MNFYICFLFIAFVNGEGNANEGVDEVLSMARPQIAKFLEVPAVEVHYNKTDERVTGYFLTTEGLLEGLDCIKRSGDVKTTVENETTILEVPISMDKVNITYEKYHYVLLNYTVNGTAYLNAPKAEAKLKMLLTGTGEKCQSTFDDVSGIAIGEMKRNLTGEGFMQFASSGIDWGKEQIDSGISNIIKLELTSAFNKALPQVNLCKYYNK